MDQPTTYALCATVLHLGFILGLGLVVWALLQIRKIEKERDALKARRNLISLLVLACLAVGCGHTPMHPAEQYPTYMCGPRSAAVGIECVQHVGMDNVRIQMGPVTWGDDQSLWHSQVQYRRDEKSEWVWVAGIDKKGNIVDGGCEHFTPYLHIGLYGFVKMLAEKGE